MSAPYDPPNLECLDCDEQCNPKDIEYGRCESCLLAFQRECQHTSRTALEGGVCAECGFKFKEPFYGKEYEHENEEG